MNLNRLLAPAIIIIWIIHFQAINKCWRRHKQGAEFGMRGLTWVIADNNMAVLPKREEIYD